MVRNRLEIENFRKLKFNQKFRFYGLFRGFFIGGVVGDRTRVLKQIVLASTCLAGLINVPKESSTPKSFTLG